ncbi:DEAD (Asp-Glu-Ala-Asp) box polypeptide 20 [Podila epigama]|nr:DEAD (Asp-Glu-Ala-Asp) box polypeptide 20 [Podila epigama]
MATFGRFHSSDVQINEDLDFSSLVSNPDLLEGLRHAGYQRPSPIQLKTIPLGRLGLDVVAQAKSGTGKTIVFSVIAIEAILSTIGATTLSSTSDMQQPPRVVILAPTREIAVQIQQVIQSLLEYKLSNRIICHAMIGGMPIQQDKINLRNCSIVVGTPGRVWSLIQTGHLRPSHIQLLVLDEADKLMEETFKEDVIQIAKGLGPSKQVMAFSATYDEDLLAQLDQLVKNPVYIMLSNGTPELEAVLQFYKVITVPEHEKTVSMFLRQNQIIQRKFVQLDSLLAHVSFYQAIVFMNHRGRASDLVKFLTRQGWPAMHIAAGITQQERLDVMAKARKFEIRVLVCSDLIARGIDIDRVNLVVNMDLPKDPETYLHRIGRTGRFGTTGLAVTLVDAIEHKTIELLKNEFSITMQELPADDDDFKELNRLSNSRHHERPLQAKEDQEMFEKLESAASKVDRSVQPACELSVSAVKRPLTMEATDAHLTEANESQAPQIPTKHQIKKRRKFEDDVPPPPPQTEETPIDCESSKTTATEPTAQAEPSLGLISSPHTSSLYQYHYGPYGPLYYYPVPYYPIAPTPAPILTTPVLFPPDLPLFPPSTHFWSYFR